MITLVLAVTCVLGVWMYRESVHGPREASGDQMLAYLPDWVLQSFDLEDTDEKTTVLPVPNAGNDPDPRDGDADVADAGVDDATPAGDAADPRAAASKSAAPAEAVEQKQPDATGERHQLTITADADSEADSDADSDGNSTGGDDAGEGNDSNGVTLQPPHRAREAFDKGMAKTYYGRHQQALVHFKQAIAIDPEFAEARYRLGKSLIKLEDFEGAAEQHRELHKLNKDLAAQLKRLLPES